jgi:hypothetical protein
MSFVSPILKTNTSETHGDAMHAQFSEGTEDPEILRRYGRSLRARCLQFACSLRARCHLHR